MEICYDGVWGSVCDSSWSDQDAAIVCLQLGLQGASKFTRNNYAIAILPSCMTMQYRNNKGLRTIII